MNGAIAAGHPLTAEAGARVLRDGGNAIDACVAAACAAFVAEGPLTGPAGGGFLQLNVDGRTTFLDCFFAAPSHSLGDMEAVVVDFADASTQVFHVGEGAVAVPGLLVGLEEAHRRFGRVPWPELVEPAIELARVGVDVGEAQAFLHGILAAMLQRDEGGRRLYGDPARVQTADLVPTLELVRDLGPGAVRELVPELADDIAAYVVGERAPRRVDFAGRSVVTAAEPSRGGAVVARALARLDDDPHSLTVLADALHNGYSHHAAATTNNLTGTTQVSVVDAAGDAASLSSTLGSGSGVFRGGTQLNNMLGELDVIGHEPFPPGARLPSMMTPTLVLEDGRPRLALGSAGSVRLAGAIVQVVGAVVARGEPLAEAIDAPRLHVDTDRRVHLEGGRPEADAQSLTDAGWEVVRWAGRNLFFGGVAAVELRADGSLEAAGDPRRGGHGIVVA
jgi:gamma-glutamyltranspeptidase/glutathione hydrolase